MKSSKSRAVFFAVLLLLAVVPLQLPIKSASANGVGTSLGAHEGVSTLSWDPTLHADWEQRIEVTVSEPNVSDRINEPIDLYLTFPPNTARNNSIRILYFNGSSWHNVTTQVWNETYNGDFYTSCTVTFLANLTKGEETTYYAYYTDEMVSGLIYEELVSYYNDTINNIGEITAANYTAKIALEYGFLIDFVIDGNDIIGEFLGAVETGIIVDNNNPWRDEVKGDEDNAVVESIITGPAFTRIVLNKTTSYDLELDRVWTFYPNYFTLESTITPDPYYSQTTIVYGRSFHNGTGSGPAYGADITAKYTVGGETEINTEYIDGSGNHANINKNGVQLPWWFAIYKQDFAYSCVPTSDSYSSINQMHYYDNRYDGNGPPHYGASGWGLYASPISSEPHTATLVYKPHPGQQDASFAQEDYERLDNPVTIALGGTENRDSNTLRVDPLDYDGGSIPNLKVQLFNASYERNETISGDIAEFDNLKSGVYNISFWYIIDSTEHQVSTNVSDINVNPGYKRLNTSVVSCGLRVLHTYAVDEDYGVPLYNYTIRLNSSTNNIDTNRASDGNGYQNFTLLTYPDDFYNISVTDPDDSARTANVTSVNLNSTSIPLWIGIAPQLNVTTLSLIFDQNSIEYAENTKTQGKLNTTTYVEVFWGDNVTFTLSFIDVTHDNTSIEDANISEWELYLIGIEDSGTATYNAGVSKYVFKLNTADYQSNVDYVIKIHFERDNCVTPSNITITLRIKPWTTTLTTTSASVIQTYWRENFTVSVNYTNTLSITDAIILGADFDYWMDGGKIGPNATKVQLGNGTLTLIINTTCLEIREHNLTMMTNHSHFQEGSLTLTLKVIAVPTTGIWTADSDFVFDSNTVRAAIGETVNVTIYANSSSPSFPDEPLTGGTSDCIWEKGNVNITSGVGVYNFSLLLSPTDIPGLTAGGYTFAVTILKSNYHPLNVYISLDLIDEWSTSVTFLNISSNTVPWGDNVTLFLRYSCTLAPRYNQSLENASIYVNWPDYWSYFDLNNGIYEIRLNTSIRSPDATYVPLAYAYRQFYENATTMEPKSFYTSKLKTSVDLVGWSASISQGEDNLLKVNLTDTDNNIAILDANLTYSIEGIAVSGRLDLVDGVYETSISTHELAAGEYWIVLDVSLPGRTVEDITFEVYDSPTGDIRFSLTIVAPFPILLIAAAFGGAVASVPIGILAWRRYKWVKLPPTVKNIVRTIRTINKGGMTDVGISQPREILINHIIADHFKSAGMSLPETGLAAPPEAFEVVPEVEELRKVVDGKFPDLPSAERESLVTELLGMDPEERDKFITALYQEKIKERPPVEEEVAEEVFKEEEYEEALQGLVEKQIITAEEKLVLIEEIKDLPPEERKKFLEKLEEK